MTTTSREGTALVVLARSHAVQLGGHFLLASGRHASIYIDMAKLLAAHASVTELAQALVREINDRFSGEQPTPHCEVVVAPPGDAAPLAYAVGEALSPQTAWVTPVGLENGLFFFDQTGNDLLKGKRALLVDDVCTSGGTLRRLAAAVRDAGGTVLVRAALWVRDHRTESKVIGLIHRELPMWDPHDCPLCKQAMPIDRKLGHGRDSAHP